MIRVILSAILGIGGCWNVLDAIEKLSLGWSPMICLDLVIGAVAIFIGGFLLYSKEEGDILKKN